MRELKFRAWVVPVRESWESENAKVRKPFMTDSFTFSDFDGDLFIPGWCQLEEMTIVQYTGLMDKKGKEIAEGDIVRYENKDAEYIESEGIGLIQRDSHSHCVNGFSCRDIKTKYYVRLLCGHSLFSIEIIGNIYKTPEYWRLQDE